jgi:O-antigen biosynthesis protein
MKPKLSIILNTYNNIDITRQCLPQLIASTGVPRSQMQIVINDNGSTDGCKEYIHRDIAPDIYFSRADNIGNPQGVNRCLSVASGEFVAKVDPDFLMPPGWAVTAIDLLQKYPLKVALVGFHWAHGWCERQEDKTSVTYSHLSLGEDMGDYYLPVKVFGVWVFRRSLIDRVGCFRDDLSMYGIWDSEFQQRIKNNGLKCVYAKTKEKCYHLGADDLRHRRFKDSELTKAHDKNVDMTLKYWNNSINFAPNPQL